VEGAQRKDVGCCWGWRRRGWSAALQATIKRAGLRRRHVSAAPMRAATTRFPGAWRSCRPRPWSASTPSRHRAGDPGRGRL